MNDHSILDLFTVLLALAILHKGVRAAGVTGVRVSMESRVEGLIEMIHDVTDKSVAVGFGISTPEAVSHFIANSTTQV